MILQTSRAFRLIIHPRAEGRWNMAVDEALMAVAAETLGPPVLRLYGFSPPTLSLGRFQRAPSPRLREALARDGITLVRRPTGGQAVLHDEELTYSVILGRGHLEPFTKREIYRFIGGLLLEGLRLLGVAGTVNRHRIGSPYHPDCFGTSGEYEISSSAGGKLIGSAQLITRGVSLQHGAIPLTDAYRRIRRYLDGGPQEAAAADGSAPAMASSPPAANRSADSPAPSAAPAANRSADSPAPSAAPAANRSADSPAPSAAPAANRSADSPAPSAAPGSLAQALGRPVSFEEAAAAFSEGYRRRLPVEVSELSERERELARRLERERYACDEWNLRL